MNAKEISDATLPTVTPAADDLMILYDVSERTTGKTPISGIAPKVAENIDISTLPAVTPAADDVLMIRDTSAGTTGKATIADIAPKVAENIVPRSNALTIISQNTTLSSPLNFTATFSGLFFITLSKSTSGHTVRIFVNRTEVFQTANYVEAYSNVLFAFVREGDNVSVSADGNGDLFRIQTAGLQKIDWITV